MHKFVITQHPKDITIYLSNEIFKIIELERGGAFPVYGDADDDFVLNSWQKFDDDLAFSNTLNSLDESSADYNPLKTIVSHLKKKSEIIHHPNDPNNKP